MKREQLTELLYQRLIWRRSSATVTLSSAEYAHLGRKSGATTLLLSATRP